MKNNSAGKARILFIVSMVIFGTIGIFRRYIPLGSATLAMSRGAIGTVALLIIMLITGKKPNTKSIRKNLVKLIASGACIGINWILLFEAFNHTTVAVATLCCYMAPVIVIIASPIVLKERLTLKKSLCAAAAVVGMVLVSGVLGNTAGTDFSGVLFGLGTAIFYGGVILISKTIKDISAYDKTVVQLASSAVVVLPYVLIKEVGTPVVMTPIAIILVLVVGIVHTGIVYALYFGSMDNLPAQDVALYSYIDPVVAILLSAFLLSEPMGVFEIIGTVLILGAMVVSEINFKKKT